MKLDCSRDPKDHDTKHWRDTPRHLRPRVWTCALCLRRVCTDCEGTDCDVEAINAVCDNCWAGVCALLGVLLSRGLVRR